MALVNTEYSKVPFQPKIMHVLPSKKDGSMPYNLIYLPQKRRMEMQAPIILCDDTIEMLDNQIVENDVVLHFHDLYAAYKYLKNRVNKNKYVITIHNDFVYMRFRNKLKLALLVLDDRCRRIVFCSKAASRGLDKVFSKVTFVDNGYPFSHQSSEQSFVGKEQDILFFGKSDDYQKNNYGLLRKLTNCSDSQFHLVGHVSKGLAQSIKNSNLRLVSHGTLSRSEVEDLQKRSCIVVSNARYEGLPLAILESVNFGAMPLLVSNAAHRYIIPSNLHKYFIFSSITKGDIEEKLKNMLTQSEVQVAFRELQSDLRKRFSQTKMLDEYDMVYSEI